MTDADFIQFAEGMDRCWRENRFHDLDTFLADDVIVVAPDGQTRKALLLLWKATVSLR